MKYFFANWKENTTYPEAIALASKVKSEAGKENFSDRTVVIFPPSVFLVSLSQMLSGSNILLGVQDVSKFEGGAYTGEISVRMIQPYAKFTLLGHSERRANFGETSKDVNQKISLCAKEGLIPLICISSKNQLDELVLPKSNGGVFVVYEPPEYIGGEKVQELSEIVDFSRMVRGKTTARFIYGGSINDQNATELLKETFLDGLLIGHSSLDAGKFGRIISFPII